MMSVRQHVIPMSEFAQAMRKTSESFAKRVGEFEDTLAVIAQATYFCWFEVEYERDYLDVCRAIGFGRPTSLNLCGQVSPRRWTEMNTYIVGVQRWLGVERPLFCELSSAKLKQIYEWLGDRIPAKEAVAELFVTNLATDLTALSLARPSRCDDPGGDRFSDFTPWYPGGEGVAGSGESPSAVVTHLKRRIRQDINSAGEDTQELMTGRPPTTRLLTELYDALGAPTDSKKAIVRDFLYGPPEGGYDWLVDRAAQDDTTVSAIFG
jgi:hypothetical protein